MVHVEALLGLLVFTQFMLALAFTLKRFAASILNYFSSIHNLSFY